MIPQEVIDAYNAVMLLKETRIYMYPSENWRVLFNFYNTNKPTGAKTLGMSCRPCYGKVIDFVHTAILEESQNA